MRLFDGRARRIVRTSYKDVPLSRRLWQGWRVVRIRVAAPRLMNSYSGLNPLDWMIRSQVCV